MVLLEDLKDFKVKQVISRFGRPYTGEEQIPSPILPPQVFNSVRLPEISKYDLALRCHVSAPVIKMIPHQLVTELVYRDVERDENGCFIPSEGMVKLAVIERHHATGSMAVGILEGLGIKHGAVASTVAHDSHNLVVAGDNDEDMLMAIESLRDCGGGYSVVSRGVVLARLPLPIAGLMTAAPVNDVLEIQQALLDALYSLGAKRDSDPLIALSFMALPVIPAVKLTDEGLFDAVNFKFIKYN
ncbi:MAG: adenine deaminase C-terminal domain-containing protein [Christensenellales bacterium]